MGTLKDEMRGLSDDHKKTDDGENQGFGSDGSAATEEPLMNNSQESSTQESYQPKQHSYGEGMDDNQTSREEQVSGEGKESVKPTDSPDADSLTQDETIAEQNQTTTQGVGDGKVGIQGEIPVDQIQCHNTENERKIGSISIKVPSTPGPSGPCTPAPFGQHHMRTQVSLEVVQCRSAATSPMTPPEGSHSFFFPKSFGRSDAEGTDTKDVELQVGTQVELCSVATSPMTPKSPYSTAFSEMIVKEKKEEERESLDNVKAESESRLAMGSIDCGVTLENRKEECKQQRMGSMDQDITILVTHYGNKEDEEEKSEASSCPGETEKDKCEEIRGNNDLKTDKEKNNNHKDAPEEVTNSTSPQKKTDEILTSACDAKTHCETSGATSKTSIPESPAPFGCHNICTQVSLEVVQCQSAATSPMTPPEGDQAFYFPSSSQRHGGAETKDAELQVGEKVEYRSVATAPMTPKTPINTTFPEVRKETSSEEKIAEYRSVATAPMTPRTPITTTFPEVRKETNLKEKISEEEVEKKEQVEYRSVATAPMTPRTPITTTFPEVRKETSLKEKISEEEEKKEQVEYRSVATAPMTPRTPITTTFPEVRKETNLKEKISEEEVEKKEQVEYRSVATAPMTPRTPITTTFPEVRKETNLKEKITEEEVEKKKEQVEYRSVATAPMTPRTPITTTFPEVRKETNLKEKISEEEVEKKEEVEYRSVATAPMTPRTPITTTFPEVRKETSLKEKISEEEVEKKEQVEYCSVATAPMTPRTPITTTFPEFKKERSSVEKIAEEEEEEKKNDKVEKEKMEVEYCSVATAPMTPRTPIITIFPDVRKETSLEDKISAEEVEKKEQVGYRSVATAPMTPRTPITTTFPEDRKEMSLEKRKKEELVEDEMEKKEEVVEEEKVKEEEKKNKEQVEGKKVEEKEYKNEQREKEKGNEEKKEQVEREQEKETEDKDEEKKEEDEEINCTEKCEEPVQEVSWDEKGMTWEVYGAVVEVTVLGSAIQKHLEKQVKKQKRQPSMPPPPPLNPSAVPLGSEGKGKRREQEGEAGRRRRNPFRQMMENMQQPHCCSRAHSAE